MYINRARLTVCVVGIFMREISQLSKIQPPPPLPTPAPALLRNHLSLLPRGIILERVQYFMTYFFRSSSSGRSSSACIAAPVYAALIDKPWLLSLIHLSRQSIMVKKSGGESIDHCLTPCMANVSQTVVQSHTTRRAQLHLFPVFRSSFSGYSSVARFGMNLP